MQRRSFLTHSAALVGAALTSKYAFAGDDAAVKDPLYQISLAQWSLHRMLRKGEIDNLAFPEFTKKTFGINAVEYVNQFFVKEVKNMDYLKQLKKRCDDNGVESVLIMCDGLGHLGAKTEKQRIQTVENHKPWIDAAKFLGCHSIRVNGHGSGSPEEAAKTVADGLTKLSTVAKEQDINVIVENHGGNSSNPDWVVGVLKNVNMDNCGTLPDFGNFHGHDRYDGIKKFMPYAKGVSAKTHEFNDKGEETRTDYTKAMKLVLDANYHGYVGIEYEGNKHSEVEGIKLTKALLERVRTQLASK